MVDDILRRLFPGQHHRYFLPMKIGSTREDADEGASLILAGIKTATSTTHWHFPAGRTPFVGALSVVLDGSDTPRGVVETERGENLAFSAVDATFAFAMGKGREHSNGGAVKWATGIAPMPQGTVRHLMQTR